MTVPVQIPLQLRQGSNSSPPPPRQEPQSNASGLLGRGREDMGDVEAFNWLVHYALLVYTTKRNQFMWPEVGVYLALSAQPVLQELETSPLILQEHQIQFLSLHGLCCQSYQVHGLLGVHLWFLWSYCTLTTPDVHPMQNLQSSSFFVLIISI